jgi:hypothetical protein
MGYRFEGPDVPEDDDSASGEAFFRSPAPVAGQTAQRRQTEYNRRRRCGRSWNLQSPSFNMSGNRHKGSSVSPQILIFVEKV